MGRIFRVVRGFRSSKIEGGERGSARGSWDFEKNWKFVNFVWMWGKNIIVKYV